MSQQQLIQLHMVYVTVYGLRSALFNFHSVISVKSEGSLAVLLFLQKIEVKCQIFYFTTDCKNNFDFNILHLLHVIMPLSKKASFLLLSCFQLIQHKSFTEIYHNISWHISTRIQVHGIS